MTPARPSASQLDRLISASDAEVASPGMRTVFLAQMQETVHCKHCNRPHEFAIEHNVITNFTAHGVLHAAAANTDLSFEEVLLEECRAVTPCWFHNDATQPCTNPNAKHDQLPKRRIRLPDTPLPRIFAMGFAWPACETTKETAERFVQLLPGDGMLNMHRLFDDEKEDASVPTHLMKGFIAYYGQARDSSVFCGPFS